MDAGSKEGFYKGSKNFWNPYAEAYCHFMVLQLHIEHIEFHRMAACFFHHFFGDFLGHIAYGPFGPYCLWT